MLWAPLRVGVWVPTAKGGCPPHPAADSSIQRICREVGVGGAGGGAGGGLLAELLFQGQLPLDSIKANVTEFTAGGVDTVRGGHGWGGVRVGVPTESRPGGGRGGGGFWGGGVCGVVEVPKVRVEGGALRGVRVPRGVRMGVSGVQGPGWGRGRVLEAVWDKVGVTEGVSVRVRDGVRVGVPGVNDLEWGQGGCPGGS